MEKKKNYYNCFSFKQKEFLNALGFGEITTKIHRETNNKFWVFTITPEFEIALKAWSYNRKQLKILNP